MNILDLKSKLYKKNYISEQDGTLKNGKKEGWWNFPSIFDGKISIKYHENYPKEFIYYHSGRLYLDDIFISGRSIMDMVYGPNSSCFCGSYFIDVSISGDLDNKYEILSDLSVYDNETRFIGYVIMKSKQIKCIKHGIKFLMNFLEGGIGKFIYNSDYIWYDGIIVGEIRYKHCHKRSHIQFPILELSVYDYPSNVIGILNKKLNALPLKIIRSKKFEDIGVVIYT